MELVCIDFAVEQWRRQSRGSRVLRVQVDCARAKFFSYFFAFSLPPRALPVDKLFSFCAASRFLMPPTSQTVAAHSLSLSLSSLVGQLLSLPFCCFGAASFSIDFRGFARPTRRLLRCLFFLFYFRAMLHLLPVLLAAFVAVVAAASTLLCAQRSIEKV